MERSSTITVKERVREELRAYAIAAIYIYVCFGALLLYRTGVLREGSVAPFPFGVAAVKALVLGKFMLIGESVRLGEGGGSRSLVAVIARKVLVFVVVLVALTLLEELLVGWVHGRSFAQTMADFESRPPLEIVATSLLLVLVLVPFVAVQQVSRALGPGALRRILLAPPARLSTPVRHDHADGVTPSLHR